MAFTDTTFLILSGILGGLLLAYSQFVEMEHRRDLIRILGAGGLFVYSYYIGNTIFMLTSGAIGLSALVEFVEILVGVHKHPNPSVKEMLRRP